MKYLPILLLIITGCTSTYIKTPVFTAYRISVLQKVGFSVVADKDGVRVNYGNSGGSDVLIAAAKISASMILR